MARTHKAQVALEPSSLVQGREERENGEGSEELDVAEKEAMYESWGRPQASADNYMEAQSNTIGCVSVSLALSLSASPGRIHQF